MKKLLLSLLFAAPLSLVCNDQAIEDSAIISEVENLVDAVAAKVEEYAAENNVSIEEAIEALQAQALENVSTEEEAEAMKALFAEVSAVLAQAEEIVIEIPSTEV